ncbi:transient receptor potential cation channel subfamily M member 2-like [Centropristis striata]|uniref:transient receptor potential cation channel subfamily M member 2-like n=1 Tax=Centropristis striata TaxID=184440 RepID=UPI0027E02A9D|nr:transient receptor potential cation channel subfamily M member 2-like [Centropristis striata]
MRETRLDVRVVHTLMTASRPSHHLSVSPSFQHHAFTTFVKDNIHKRECFLYEKGDREDICRCGYSKTDHVDEAIKPEDFTDESWDRHKHIREVPSDAFGDISFGGLGQTTGKYVRVSTDTSPEILYRLLTEQWKLSPPNLLISVTGGAKNFYLKSRLKNMFHRGLIKVTQTTGAWIITGGTHAGVMKHVGQAVRDYSLSSMKGQIVAIGVATWGTIHNRETLVHPEGRFPAQYVMDVKGQGRFSCLDNNHTHFLLVDDGTNGNYGVEIELRSQLEKCISRKRLGNIESGVNIPVVCVVLDGGPGTLNTIYNAMLNGTPCVVLEGSGRIADVIAQVATLPVKRVTIAHIHELMQKFFGPEYDKFSDRMILEWTKKIQDIIRMPHLLTIFRISEDNHVGVDVAILQGLLKASKMSESLGMESWKRQLELAIAWNRVDIAETEIFTEESQWKSSDLHWAMFSALVGNKPQFVSLLLENGVSLRDFLDEETLCDLYKQLPSCIFLRKLAKRVHSSYRRKKTFRRRRVHSGPGQMISMTHVSDEVRKLLGSFTKALYPDPPSNTTYHCNMLMEDTSVSLSKTETGSKASLKEEEVKDERDPGRDLFLWAILQNNKELAEIAWEQCRDCMSAALAASKILKTMAKEGSDGDEAAAMKELADHYEKHAMGVFSECHNCDQERAQKLLVRASPSWGKTTCLRLALEADDKSFVAQSGVQVLLTQIWCGELSVENPVWRVLICMVFSPLIYTGFLVYRRDEILQREAEKNEEIKTVETVTGSTLRTNSRRLDPSSERLKPLGPWSRLVCLHSSPQVKFYWNIVFYFAFLFLFAVVLMIDFQDTPSAGEVLLYIWLMSLVCEEVRQLFYDPDGFGFRKKARMYLNELWNILDVLSILLFIIGLAFRLTTELFYAGKVLLCIDFVVFCLRLMAIFTISKTLGPKIIIVRKMMMDMFFFMFLLSIWVVAYGVAKQGILIHNDNRLGWILRGAVYEPYLIIFGDVPDNIDYAEFDIEKCTMNGSDPLKPKCPVLNENQMPAFPEWLTIIMLCIYLLFANILLLNLLIAIFNFTFQEVQDNTDRIWKFQRYELIKEYHSRPAAPPPFIIFSHLYIFVKNVVLCRPPLRSTDFKCELPPSEEEELLSWEALMKDRYLLSTQEEQSQSMERRIMDTAQKVTTMNDLMEREEEEQRLARLEDQVVQSARALQWIMESLKCRGFAANEPPPLILAGSDESPDTLRNAEKEDRFHIKARQFHYPNSKETRFPVPEEKVPWEVSFSSYRPVKYASEDGGDQMDGSESEDPDIHRNPEGRTGMMGRGALSRFGPNLNVELVLTRWCDGKRSVLQHLVVWDESHGTLTLPSGPAESADELPGSLKKTMGKKIYEIINAKVSEGTKVLDSVYVDDCRNTDNAWVETTLLNIHLDRMDLTVMDIDSLVTSSHGALQWREVSGKTRLSPNQRESLRYVAELHNTKF